MPICKKKKKKPFIKGIKVPFITSPNRVVKAMMSPSRCPWRGHRWLNLSGTSAIQVPIKSSLLKGRIEIILVQSLAGGEEGRIQTLDMSTQKFTRMVVSACPSMKLCSAILPPQSPSSVISLHTHYFAPPLDVYCCGTLFCTGFMSIYLYLFIQYWERLDGQASEDMMHTYVLSHFSCVWLCVTLQPARLLCPWDSPGKNIGVGCHALLRGIFLTQGSNPVS